MEGEDKRNRGRRLRLTAANQLALDVQRVTIGIDHFKVTDVAVFGLPSIRRPTVKKLCPHLKFSEIRRTGRKVEHLIQNASVSAKDRPASFSYDTV